MSFFTIKFKRRDNVLTFLGFACLVYWIFDFVNIVFLSSRPTWLLWYSSAGLFFTGVALLAQSALLINSMFVALFFIEVVWSADFLFALVFHRSLFGLTAYVFLPGFSRKDFYMTFYHLLVPISLAIAVLRTQRIFRYAWIGAILFAGAIGILTYLFVKSNDRVNCLYPAPGCHMAFSSFLYRFPTIARVFIALLLLTILIFLPTNYILTRIGSHLHWKESRIS